MAKNTNSWYKPGTPTIIGGFLFIIGAVINFIIIFKNEQNKQ